MDLSKFLLLIPATVWIIATAAASEPSGNLRGREERIPFGTNYFNGDVVGEWNHGESITTSTEYTDNMNLNAPDPSFSLDRPNQRNVQASNSAWVDRTFTSDLSLENQLQQFQTGRLPADPHGAAGPYSVISTVSSHVEGRDKLGNVLFAMTSLNEMFASLNPQVTLMTPQILFDSIAERFVLVVQHAYNGGATGGSYDTMMAISKTNDPKNTTAADWSFYSFSTMFAPDTTTGSSSLGITQPVYARGTPSLAVDEEAIYITRDMYAGFTFQGSFVWILNKDSYYNHDDPNTDPNAYTVHNFIAEATGNNGVLLSGHKPAMVRNVNGIPDTVGTYIVGYTGFHYSVTEASILQVIRIDNPLTNPTFTVSWINMGVFDTTVGEMGMLPNSPQKDSSAELSTGSRAVQSAVWNEGKLWIVAAATDEDGETAVFWAQILVNGTSVPVLSGTVHMMDGEDIAPGTRTFYPSLDVYPGTGQAAIGFSAAGPNIYPSAYAVLVDTDGSILQTTTGTVSPPPPDVVMTGTHPHEGSQNFHYWGRSSSTSIDPTEPNCFWTFNQYGADECTSFLPAGCWATGWARLCSSSNLSTNNGDDDDDETVPSQSPAPSQSVMPSMSLLPTIIV